MLGSGGHHHVGLAGVSDYPATAEAHLAGGGHEAGAPVAEGVAIRGERHGGCSGEVIGNAKVRDARVMYVDEQDHRRLLRTAVEEVIADTDVHEGLSFFIFAVRCCDAFMVQSSQQSFWGQPERLAPYAGRFPRFCASNDQRLHGGHGGLLDSPRAVRLRISATNRMGQVWETVKVGSM